jgi:2-polyprenyl-3-methyl-5-hydroxy-6-metoxy-1,4-benzoquinol methylase
MADTYYLPDGYQTNPVNITLDQDGAFYWNSERVRYSAKYQFPAYQWADAIAREKNVQTIFDVGCGFAAKLHWLYKRHPKKTFWGIDQPNAVALCRDHYKFGQWLGVDLENNPETPLVQADLTISSDVIEHLEKPDILLDYLRRVTKPGGYILISTPERKVMRGADCMASLNPYHVREWSYDEFANYIESRGFNIIEHRILPCIGLECSRFFFRIALRRWLRGQSLRYNQAVLIRNK